MWLSALISIGILVSVVTLPFIKLAAIGRPLDLKKTVPPLLVGLVFAAALGIVHGVVRGRRDWRNRQKR